MKNERQTQTVMFRAQKQAPSGLEHVCSPIFATYLQSPDLTSLQSLQVYVSHVDAHKHF